MVKKVLLITLFLTLVAGCAKKQIVKPQVPVTPPQTDEEPSVRSDSWQSIPQLKAIYFEFDRADLGDTTRQTLRNNADHLKNNPNIDILVEGHCDRRGTTEYNLALGQKRAAAVREYYSKLGVPLRRIATISYGNEQPVDPRNTEEAWAKNRRVETKVKGNR
ncbi:MAG: peptidoglycan-associated lipoprotein [Elusimicrobia bacterium RIFOXYB2_FULL_49_7]|nr:MAG: peptidoglycan-associated lipoprotein [Elusimicrobia bacterium RIFOXYB2_FULL_49_7]